MTASCPQVTTELVRRLVDTQFPQWRGLPLRRVDPGGSDHLIHRLGAELSVRLPRHDGAIGQAAKELAPAPRAAFRAALGADDATWLRGRGWALAAGLNAFRSYAATSPRIAAATTRQVLAALEG